MSDKKKIELSEEEQMKVSGKGDDFFTRRDIHQIKLTDGRVVWYDPIRMECSQDREYLVLCRQRAGIRE